MSARAAGYRGGTQNRGGKTSSSVIGAHYKNRSAVSFRCVRKPEDTLPSRPRCGPEATRRPVDFANDYERCVQRRTQPPLNYGERVICTTVRDGQRPATARERRSHRDGTDHMKSLDCDQYGDTHYRSDVRYYGDANSCQPYDERRHSGHHTHRGPDVLKSARDGRRRTEKVAVSTDFKGGRERRPQSAMSMSAGRMQAWSDEPNYPRGEDFMHPDEVHRCPCRCDCHEPEPVWRDDLREHRTGRVETYKEELAQYNRDKQRQNHFSTRAKSCHGDRERRNDERLRENATRLRNEAEMLRSGAQQRRTWAEYREKHDCNCCDNCYEDCRDSIGEYESRALAAARDLSQAELRGGRDRRDRHHEHADVDWYEEWRRDQNYPPECRACTQRY